MKKEQFIKNLRYSLRKLKKDEREKYLAYYEEIISDMIENGVSEEEAVAHQGETKEIAEEILRENAVKREFKIGWIGTVLIILTLLCGMVSGYLMYQEYQIKSEFAEKLQGEVANETISLIGGADGPTRVFLAGKITFSVRPDILFVITLLLLATYSLYFMRKIKKNKKKE
ncbi:MAG: HAAS signaling domain-containing protein [Mediterraneibacter gnavus]